MHIFIHIYIKNKMKYKKAISIIFKNFIINFIFMKV